MGYTNYWNQERDFADDEWQLMQQEARYLKELGFDVRIDVNNIYIDGESELMNLRRYKRTMKHYEEDNLAFNFCKTRMHKYDLAVWYLLCSCRQLIQDDFIIWRDR